MPFLSIEFALFFLIFLAVYWLFKPSPRVQNFLLLAAGLAWLGYLSLGAMLAVLVFSMAIFVLAQGIIQSEAHRRFYLIAGVFLAIGNLFFFKYFDFFRPALQQWLGHNEIVDILMPLGISYYTFQAIAYLVSVYRNGKEFALRPLNLLLHFSFFPTITSGPIIRASDFKTGVGVQQGAALQIQTQKTRSVIQPALAVSLILLGITKKWWLSGSLADGWVNPVFENPLQYDAISVLTAMYGYTVQLFLDFSGYSDLVIGMALLLGFRLPQNFNMPLRAFNIRDFWDRWHISLSSWIRDYIYIPLGGSRKGFTRTQINLMVAMVLSGVWHGYGWNFLLWGFLHGAALILLNVGDLLLGKREVLASTKVGRVIGVLFTLHFVVAAFVVFRTASLEDTGLMFHALLNNPYTLVLPELSTVLLLLVFMISLAFYGVLVKGFNGFVALLESLPVWLWALPIAVVMVLLMVLAPSGIPGFIYANF